MQERDDSEPGVNRGDFFRFVLKCRLRMHLYALTLQKSSAINVAVYGNFSGPKLQEFAVARGRYLELLRVDDAGLVQSVSTTDVFGVIRSLKPFRLLGSMIDYLVIGSDSGKIVIVEWVVASNTWKRVHEETFGRTGCRRIVPGQYLAVDPKGRAILIGALEKQKLVYVMNRDAAAKLTISSPLESHKTNTIMFDVVSVDNGFDNPLFACLELDYSDADTDPTGAAVTNAAKLLTYYELDLGLNHVIRKWSEETDRSANGLVAVPGAPDGPGGVLVLAENFVLYKRPDHRVVRTPIPYRSDFPADRGLLLVARAVHKIKDVFFALVQSELGDLYLVHLDYTGTTVNNVRVKYFDTIPPANSLCITKMGLLFVASEFGNHGVYQFQGLGDKGEHVEANSSDVSDDGTVTMSFFTPQPLSNLAMVQQLDSLAPILDIAVDDLAGVGNNNNQLYTLCGRSVRSSLRILRHGLAVEESANSPMPGNPHSVWALPAMKDDPNSRYIVVSFVDATFVLAVGETVEETQESGLELRYPTLACSLMDGDVLLQVHAAGVRQIVGHAAGEKRVIEWPAPGKKTITQAACNSRQCAVALSGGEVVYFELDASYELVEKERRELGSEVRCMALGPVPTGSQRCDFLAVGDARSAHVWSTRPDKTLQSLSTQALREGDSCSSLVLMELPVKSMDHHGLYLNLGTDNGLLYRSEVDRGNGQLTETHTRFLGPRPVKLSCVKVAGKNALLALSDRTWLSHRHHNNFLTAPLAYDALDAAAPLVSQDFDCIVAIADGTLRVFTVEKLGQLFNQQHVPLRYTPRKSSVNPVTRRLVVIETDHNAFNSVEKAQLKLAAAGGEEEDTDTGRPATVSQAPKDGGYESDEMEVDEPAASSAPAPAPVAELPLVVEVDDVTPADEAEEGVETVPEYMRRVGPPIPGVAGKWASCIRVFDPMALATLQVVELPDNEAAFSVAHVQFFEKSHEMFLLVGTVRDMTLHPRKHSGGFIRTYRYNHDGSQIELVHKTEVEDVPYTITQFSAYGKALVGVGNVVRVYDLGKKKLLRKCETKALPTLVQSIHCNGDRVYAGDASDSFVFLKYRRSENVLVSFADDLCARYLTASCMVDYSTVAGADKFGNVFLLRLPKEVGEDVDNPTGDRILWDSGWLGGAPHKLDLLAHYHVGDLVTSLKKASLPGGTEVLVYGTVTGAIGALLPITTREDADFFTHLEMYIRVENLSLIGRDHLNYRCATVPVKKSIADDLGRTVGEVVKKLEDIRARIL